MTGQAVTISFLAISGAKGTASIERLIPSGTL
jgi:hypothetical protein